jgi:hypothetical protein
MPSEAEFDLLAHDDLLTGTLLVVYAGHAKADAVSRSR